ncbi:SRPBCC family protein [Kitasatospora sp. NPDC001175]|uniref:SRPBCC family protein n=1 Tax=Kitasatospora sp. NPDC001175 TaxID=3157103 RepID=UPI003D08C455
MDPNHYRLSSVWQLPAEPDRVYRALEDVACYPQWWPQIRSVRQLDAHSGELAIRSILPYGLRVTVREQYRDAAAGLLEAELGGDLQGWSRWRVCPAARGPGARVLFEEDVRPAKALMRRLAPIARPLFIANHAAMMRAGQRGLGAHLA